MALIKCPECNKDISEKATLCPQCGYPIADKIDEINAKKINEANHQIIDNACDDKEVITICNKCGKLEIIEKKYIHDYSYCYICGGRPIRVIMKRSEWFLMSESEMDKTAQKYIDEVESSPNVDKEMFLKYGSISSNVLFYKNFIVYCPHCGEYTNKYEGYKYNNNICTYCGSEYVTLDILSYDFYRDTYGNNSRYEYILNKYLINDPQFDKSLRNKRMVDKAYSQRMSQKCTEWYDNKGKPSQTSSKPTQQTSSKTTIKCPTCGSTNVTKISGTNKVGSAALFGIFSLGHISKTFKCNNCGYKW